MKITGLKAYWQSGWKKPESRIQVSLLILIIFCSLLSQRISAFPAEQFHSPQTGPDNKILLNGRIWRNQYAKTFGDPYFLANTYLKGSVTINGQQFNNLDFKFDIANDELILNVESHPTIMLNKEMVDSFTLKFENSDYKIINAGNDTSNVLKGYVNVIYEGPSSLYVKYVKKLQLLAVDGRYDLFFQEHRIYIRKGNEIVSITGKRSLLKLMYYRKKDIRNFIKSQKLKITRKDPGTFVPVLKYYDSVTEQEERK